MTSAVENIGGVLAIVVVAYVTTYVQATRRAPRRGFYEPGFFDYNGQRAVLDHGQGRKGTRYWIAFVVLIVIADALVKGLPLVLRLVGCLALGLAARPVFQQLSERDPDR